MTADFSGAQRAEHGYARLLRKIARHIADIVNGFAPDGDVTPTYDALITDALSRYSESLTGWAEAVGQRMITDVGHRDAQSWMAHSSRIGRALKRQVADTPVGHIMRGRLADQVTLIKSLPLEAAQRVHDLALENFTTGTRLDNIRDMIMASGQVSASRANMIARTEVARTASAFTQARAESIGSPGYHWKTSRDEAVRPSHRAMQDKLVLWSSPPTLDGMTGHAGCFPNCRCNAFPVLPE